MDRRFLVALALLAAPLSAQTQFGTLGPDEMRAHFVNVGQGDATILEFVCGLMLVDAGRGRDGIPDDVLTDYLRRLFAERARNTSRQQGATVFLRNRGKAHCYHTANGRGQKLSSAVAPLDSPPRHVVSRYLGLFARAHEKAAE
ncbi:MAG: hypothetical protein IIA72_07680 [Proteobacteria bacterium]|nr:hypothetical protein [Pseudomonadota bacterium]